VRNNCKEALFLMGERPEEVAPEIREVLASRGYEGMLEYLCSMCEMALEFGMLPHTNAGLLHGYELERLRRVNASMGLMLESSSERLCRAGGPHERSPGKLPALRLQCIEEAGKRRIPLTTGILVGIGEEPAERIEALGVLKELHRRYGHIQEIIIQQFCPKSGTPMAAVEEPPTEEMLRTIVFARLMFGKAMNIQAPYNLIPRSHHLYLRAGANDWGGISPLTRDVINPEKKRPDLADVERKTRSAGYVLKERLAVYPEFMSDEYLSPRIRGVALSLVQPDVYAGVKSDA
jgi:7,8-didemethyl-8-hydroxy-5-deazariboflavin synthase CofG subunit